MSLCLLLLHICTNVLTATSTGVERVFSAGRQLLSYTRNRLLGPSIRRNMCLGSWCCHDLIPLDVLMGVIQQVMRKDKGGVKKGKGKKRLRDSDQDVVSTDMEVL